MISINNLSVNVSGKKLWSDLSLVISHGDNIVLTGNNGAGKTLLLETLAGMHHPLSGNIHYSFIDEKLDWEEQYEIRRKALLYIPANAFHQFLNNKHEAFYQQRYYSMGAQTAPTVGEVIGDELEQISNFNFPSEFKINHLLSLEVTRISNGQAKKLLIIKHLIKQTPKILLLDYPFEGLDRDSRKAFSEFLDHVVRRANIQIILVDHHHDLPTVINRKIVIENFRIASGGGLRPSRNAGAISNPDNPLLEGSEILVEMKNVTIQYGQTKVIADFNWKVRKGERWALTGRNGAGKTTLFGMIYADHPMAYSEEVYLFGKRRGTGESIWDIKHRISYLGPEQMHFLNPKGIAMACREYILSVQNKPLQLDALERFFSAGDLLMKRVSQLSTGEVQMMLLMIFFLSDKELLLLDEPFQFLDPENKSKVNEYLHNFLRAESTLILITHYESDIAEWTQLRKHLG